MTMPFEIRGDGYLEEVKPGVWDCYFSLGYDPKTKKYKRSPKRRFHCKSKTEAKRLKAEFKAELERNQGKPSKARGVTSYARDLYERKSDVGPRGKERRDLDLKHIDELLGERDIRALAKSDIETVYAQVRKSRRFSESELARIDMRLREIMRAAMEERLIDANPMASVSKPKPRPREKEYPSRQTLARLNSVLLHEQKTSNTACIWLMLQTGMRKGEALGLGWEYVDLENARIRIRWQYTNDKVIRPPKSASSRRFVTISDECVEYLKQWKTQVEKTFGKLPSVETMAVNEAGREESIVLHPVVFDSSLGLYDPTNYDRWFKMFSVDHGFGEYGTVTKTFTDSLGVEHQRGKDYRGLTPHMLRHGQATILCSQGVDAKTTQGRLGHSNFSTTMNIYTHFQQENDRIASAAFQRALSKE